MTIKAINENDMRFKLYVPSDLNKNYELNEDGTLTIEGVASTTNKDLQGDIVLQSAIDSMKHQLTTSHKNLHGDHEYKLFDGIIGAIKEVVDSADNLLKIKAIIRSKYAQEVKEMLDIGINLGLSIGGRVTDYNPINNGWEIKDIDLFEISLTGMPANYDTFGTVTTTKNNIVEAKCLAGACNLIRKKYMGDNNMPEPNPNPNPQNDEVMTEEKVKSICKNYMNEYLAENQEAIQSAAIEACKADVERMIDDKIKELTLPSEPQNNSGEGSEKDIAEILSDFKDEIKEELGKNVFTEENFKKGLADFIKNERNPEPTPAPRNTPGDEANKTYTAEEIFKNIQTQNKSNSLFNRLGANMEE
ncbi:MAG: hypothetical protein IJQ68_10395 [Methanobrevibacter sp.]|uniref:hypothetical protein n=1 Tax=Methanobrevibacter sp. TaxID=66852 RepID=UPI0025D1F471|nr:hypothetical protein [Methanobrevibacter sp.]MBR0272376.1 hypothetical protein [Methanobrevibacter sp.]